MKAAILREVGKPLSIEEVQIGKPGPHEVLIRTVAAPVAGGTWMAVMRRVETDGDNVKVVLH